MPASNPLAFSSFDNLDPISSICSAVSTLGIIIESKHFPASETIKEISSIPNSEICSLTRTEIDFWPNLPSRRLAITRARAESFLYSKLNLQGLRKIHPLLVDEHSQSFYCLNQGQQVQSALRCIYFLSFNSFRISSECSPNFGPAETILPGVFESFATMFCMRIPSTLVKLSLR